MGEPRFDLSHEVGMHVAGKAPAQEGRHDADDGSIQKNPNWWVAKGDESVSLDGDFVSEALNPEEKLLSKEELLEQIALDAMKAGPVLVKRSTEKPPITAKHLRREQKGKPEPVVIHKMSSVKGPSVTDVAPGVQRRRSEPVIPMEAAPLSTPSAMKEAYVSGGVSVPEAVAAIPAAEPPKKNGSWFTTVPTRPPGATSSVEPRAPQPKNVAEDFRAPSDAGEAEQRKQSLLSKLVNKFNFGKPPKRDSSSRDASL